MEFRLWQAFNKIFQHRHFSIRQGFDDWTGKILRCSVTVADNLESTCLSIGVIHFSPFRESVKWALSE
jgi:hypothetical protein